jgi:hypothetical protein
MIQSNIQSLPICPVAYVTYKSLTKHGGKGLTKEPETHCYAGDTVTLLFKMLCYWSANENYRCIDAILDQ